MVVLLMKIKPCIAIIEDAEDFIKIIEDMQKAYLNNGGAANGD